MCHRLIIAVPNFRFTARFVFVLFRGGGLFVVVVYVVYVVFGAPLLGDAFVAFMVLALVFRGFFFLRRNAAFHGFVFNQLVVLVGQRIRACVDLLLLLLRPTDVGIGGDFLLLGVVTFELVFAL